ncbi:MAG: TonB-dependent siderophore receptor [Porticoccaceae bacterium]
MRHRFHLLRPLAFALQCSLLALPAVGLSFTLSHGAHAQEAAAQIQVPAGPLSEAINHLAQQLGVAVVMDEKKLAGLRSGGLQGAYNAEQGFAALLAGSGHEARKTPSGYVIVAAKNEVVTLSTVRVRDTLVSGTSEGTGSYAAQAATLFKGAQSLREIPQSVTVMTRQRIEDQNLNNVAEVLLNTAGISQAAAVEPTKFFSRGYELQTQVDGSPGLSLAFTSPYDAALYDRIEVLRGPAGLLSGSGEPGGTVNLVRKRPLENFAVSGSLGAGSWDHYRGNIDASSPLNKSGSLRGRMVVAGEDRDNFIDLDYRRTLTGYGVLEVDLGENTTVGLTVAGHEQKRQGSGDGGPLGRPRDSFVGADVQRRSTRLDYGIDVEHRLSGTWLDGWVIKGNLAQAEHERDGNTSWLSSYDAATGAGELYLYPLHALYESQNLDMNVSGPFQLWGQQHHLTLGYNWALGEDTTDRINWAGAPIQLDDILTEHHFSEDQNIGTTGNYGKTRTKQSGLYSALRLSVLDDLTLVVGGRFSNYERDTRTATTGWVASGARARSEFSPYGGLIWDVSEPVSLYASYADIFIPQTQKTFEGNTLDPRVGWQGEVGAKGEFFDGRLNASVAVFRMRDKNRALRDERYANTACNGSACYVAAGLAQSQGWELEINGAPLPNWELSASYTRNDTKFLRDSNMANVGKPVAVSVPRHMAKLWTVYRFDTQDFGGALHGWSLGGGINAQSETYEGRQSGYALYSLQLGYSVDPHWSITLTGNNLTDKRYYSAAEGGSSWNLWGEPRNVMLMVRYRM